VEKVHSQRPEDMKGCNRGKIAGRVKKGKEDQQKKTWAGGTEITLGKLLSGGKPSGPGRRKSVRKKRKKKNLKGPLQKPTGVVAPQKCNRGRKSNLCEEQGRGGK